MATDWEKKMHKDVKLEYKGHGQFDRKLVGGDWEVVTGIEALQAGIIVKLMTIYGELPNNPTYNNWGNKSWWLLKDNNHRIAQIKKKEYTKTALEEINRIGSVNLVEVLADIINPFALDTNIAVTPKGANVAVPVTVW